MPCSYYAISICSRGNGSSSVASSAYQSGERLFDERSDSQKYYSNKGGIVHSEILLPENAPEEFEDRNTLWNSVERVEKQYNSQLARKIVAALPKEIPTEDQIQLVRDYCKENFVDAGMCVDFAIHDKGDGNPHVHMMLTIRPMDENGEWMPKSRKVYDLDDDGNKILLPSGYYKSHKEKTTDWDDQSKAEVWRHSWEEHTNRFLEKNGVEERLDMRSYERQGKDQIPQIHMGPAVYQMEKRGEHTFVGDLNRLIQKMNEQLTQIKQTIDDLLKRVQSLQEKLIVAIRENTIPPIKNDPPITLEDFLVSYLHEKENNRSLEVSDKQLVLRSLDYLKRHSINTIPDLERNLRRAKDDVSNVQYKIDRNMKRIHQINEYKRCYSYCREKTPMIKEYSKIVFKRPREKYYQAHKKEIDNYRKAVVVVKKLQAAYPDQKIPWKKLEQESKKLQADNKQLQAKATSLEKHVKELGKVLGYAENTMLKDIVRARREQEEIRRREAPQHQPRRKSYDLER